MNRIKILIIEDDRSLGPTLSERVAREGYTTKLAPTLLEAKRYLQEHSPDLIILDVGLPDGNGFDFAKDYLNSPDSPPFIFLTALSGAEERLKGFELGAEEFIPKPFHLKEILLRIHHVLKIHKRFEEVQVKNIIFYNYKILFDNFEIVSPKGERFSLSKRECGLLQLLVQNKEKAISRDEILNRVWGEDKFPTNRTIDNCIVKLRQCLGEKGNEAIQSIRGVGYKWVGEFTELSS